MLNKTRIAVLVYGGGTNLQALLDAQTAGRLAHGEIVLVDYKTDRVQTEDEIRQRAEHYRIQLETYAGALELLRSCGCVAGDSCKEEFVYLVNLLERGN